MLTRDGASHQREKSAYHGFWTESFDWQDAVEKFTELTTAIPKLRREAIVKCVAELETRSASELGELLEAGS